MKTAKILMASAFELSCPDCKDEYGQGVEGPSGSITIVYWDEFPVHNPQPNPSDYLDWKEEAENRDKAYCLDCGQHLKLPVLPKTVRTIKGVK